MSIRDNISKLKEQLPSTVKLITVSKTNPVESIREAYDAGQRLFGENRVQEIVDKQHQLPVDIEWHFIGHLQSNKVKFIAPFVSMIHSIDSLKLLAEVNREAYKNNRVIDCLLEMYVATEENKFGLDMNEVFSLLESSEFIEMKNIRICGIMGMATFTDYTDVVRKEFKSMRAYFEIIKEKYFSASLSFKEISMGMSSDYKIAIEEGSSMVRIGTAIFGSRT
jgi:hypothetical protein